MLSSYGSIAQNPIEIGKVQNESYRITIDTVAVRKAIEATLTDDTQIYSLRIESVNQWHYLIAQGMHLNYQKVVAIELTYDIGTRTFWTKVNGGYKTCASAACLTCVPFKENGNIIGCHCVDQQTISNECTYKHIPNSLFHKKLAHYLAVKPAR